MTLHGQLLGVQRHEVIRCLWFAGALVLGLQADGRAATAASARLEQACAGAPPPPIGGETAIIYRRSEEDATAWALACAQRRQGPEGFLGVIEALMPRLPADQVQALMDAFSAQPIPPPLRGRWLLARSDLALKRGQNETSRQLALEALAQLGPSGEAAAVRGRLNLAHQVLRLDGITSHGQVRVWVDEAKARLEAAGRIDSLAYVDAERIQVALAGYSDDWTTALGLIDSQIARLERLGQVLSGRMVYTLCGRANTMAYMGRLDEAMAAADQAAAILEHLSEPPGYAAACLAESYYVVLMRMGRPADALVHVERGLAHVRRALPVGSSVFVKLMWRAEALLALRRWTEARQSIEEAQALGDQSGGNFGPMRLATVAALHAQVLTMLGEPEAAHAAVERGLAIMRPLGNRFSILHRRVQGQKAALASRAGDWSAAERAYADALALQSPRLGAADLLPLQAGRCVAQQQARLPGDACAQLRRYEAQADSLSAYLRFQLFHALAQSTAGAEALSHHLRALAAAGEADGPDPLWAALDALARHWRGKGRHEMAVLAAKQAVLQIEAMRDHSHADAQRLERGFFSDKLPVYRRLADWLAEDGRIAEAMQVLRLQQGEEFREFVRRDASLVGKRGPVTTAELMSEAEQRLWQDWLGPDLAGPPPALASERRVQEWLSALQRQPLRPADAEIRLPLLRTAPLPLPPRGVLRATLFPGQQHLHLIFTDTAGQEALQLPLSAPDVARRVGQALDAIGRRAPPAELAPILRAWYADLGAALLDTARRRGATQLQLDVFGALRYLPVAALDDGNGPLGTRITLVQLVDDADMPGRGARQDAAALQVLAVTRAVGGLPALPALAQEVCDIVRGPVTGGPACAAGALPGRAWLNEGFTRERLTQAAQGGGNLLHVGSHFVLRPGHMGRSWLLLGDGGRLTLDDLAKLDFSSQDLVTLSACDTGLGGGTGGGALQGEEVQGLNQLVIRRGATAVLASLWRVEDASTAALMSAFYRALADGMTAPKALRHAQTGLQSQPRWRHPYHWAGFYLASR